MEHASDILLILGALVVIAALALIWKPLGLLALGVALLALGLLCGLKAHKKKAVASGQ